MRHFPPSIVVALGFAGLITPLRAQNTDPGVEAGVAVAQGEPASEAQHFEIEKAGFALDMAAAYEPTIHERSNGSLYALSVVRRDIGGGAYGTDGKMAFMRLTQTIKPLAEIGSEKDMFDSIVRDATRSLDEAYGAAPDRELSDCSREILGEVREGRRIAAGTLGDGSIAYAECYVFEDSKGKGIGVTLKMTEPADGAPSEDARLAQEMLDGLRVKDLEPDSAYFYSFAGYPLRLPVASSIQNLRQVNDYVVEATIAFERASARVQLIKVPAEYNPRKTASEQVSGYAGMLQQQAEQGQLTLKRSTRSYILGGAHRDGIIEGMSFLLNTNNTDYYNTMHAAADHGVVLAVSFTGAESDADIVTRYVTDFFARPLDSVEQGTRTSVFDGYALELPDALSFLARDTPGERDQFIVTTSSSLVWQWLVESPLTGAYGHTRILSERPGSAMTLASAHRWLCETELNRLGGEASPAASLESAPVESSIVLEDGRRVPALTTTLTPVIGAETLKERKIDKASEITITSYGIPAEAGRAVLVVSTVASTGVYAETDQITRLVIDRIGAMETPAHVSLTFGDLTLPSFGASVTEKAMRDYDSFAEDVQLTIGGDTVRIRTMRDEPRNEVLSSRLLAGQYLPTVWRSVTSGDEQDRFPQDTGSLASVEFAGRTAAMFESQLAATGKIMGTGRMEAMFVRVLGFAHGKKYTTVVIEQGGEKDVDRLDRIMGLFHGPADGGD